MNWRQWEAEMHQYVYTYGRWKKTSPLCSAKKANSSKNKHKENANSGPRDRMNRAVTGKELGQTCLLDASCSSLNTTKAWCARSK